MQFNQSLMAANNYINIKINIKDRKILFTKFENDKGENGGESPFDIEDDDSGANNIRVELGIAKVFHKVLNLIKTERDLFQKEDFELLGEMLSKILFGKIQKDMSGKIQKDSDVRSYIMKDVEQTLEISKPAGKKICRIFLEFDQKSGVAMLPWEYTLYKTRNTKEAVSIYMSANIKNGFHLMRRVKENQTPEPAAEKLFIIVLLSVDGNSDAVPPIDSRTSELSKIKNSFAKLKVKNGDKLEVAYIENTALKDIKKEIEDIYTQWENKFKQRPYYILHYVGHSMLENQIGKLVIKDSGDGKPVWTEDKKFASLFRQDMLNVEQPSIVCFQACDSAKIGSINDSLRGVAYEFTKLNIPAVIGMQNEIDTDNAVAFFDRFYDRILNAKDVCEAVTAGRDYLGREFNLDTEPYVNNSFGSPVLFITTTEPVTLMKEFPVVGETIIQQPVQEVFTKITPSDIDNRASIKIEQNEQIAPAAISSKMEEEPSQRLAVSENPLRNNAAPGRQMMNDRGAAVSNLSPNQPD